MCSRAMTIVVINMPMCQSFLTRPVAGGGGSGRTNKGNVRSAIRPTCLKAALTLEELQEV